jgi:hypothetical protein
MDRETHVLQLMSSTTRSDMAGTNSAHTILGDAAALNPIVHLASAFDEPGGAYRSCDIL